MERGEPAGTSLGASEMQKILEPFATAGNIVRVDTRRNLIILAGSGPEVLRLLETVEIFDVDWLEGMSVALFTPDFVDAAILTKELEIVFGESSEGPLAGLIEFVPLERQQAADLLERDTCDVVVGAIWGTLDVYTVTTATRPYLELRFAVVLPDYSKLRTLDDLEKAGDALTVCLIRSDFFENRIRKTLPDARIVLLETEAEFFARNRDDGAVLFSTVSLPSSCYSASPRGGGPSRAPEPEAEPTCGLGRLELTTQEVTHRPTGSCLDRAFRWVGGAAFVADTKRRLEGQDHVLQCHPGKSRQTRTHQG